MATAITLTPGRAALADWRAAADGAAVGWAGFDPKWRLLSRRNCRDPQPTGRRGLIRFMGLSLTRASCETIAARPSHTKLQELNRTPRTRLMR
jgi:hypothetical protein